eukprot:5074078-Amphidinium_carterae.1
MPEKRRFGDPWKFLPVAFIAVTISTLYSIYIFAHCFSLLQLSVDADRLDEDMRRRGIVEMVIFNCFFVLLLIAYVRSILVHPGEVPDRDPQWKSKQVATPPPGNYLQ